MLGWARGPLTYRLFDRVAETLWLVPAVWAPGGNAGATGGGCGQVVPAGVDAFASVRPSRRGSGWCLPAAGSSAPERRRASHSLCSGSLPYGCASPPLGAVFGLAITTAHPMGAKEAPDERREPGRPPDARPRASLNPVRHSDRTVAASAGPSRQRRSLRVGEVLRRPGQGLRRAPGQGTADRGRAGSSSTSGRPTTAASARSSTWSPAPSSSSAASRPIASRPAWPAMAASSRRADLRHLLGPRPPVAGPKEAAHVTITPVSNSWVPSSAWRESLEGTQLFDPE